MAFRGLLSSVASWRDSLRLRVWRSVGRSLRLWVFVRRCSNTGRGASCGGSWGYGSGCGFCILSAFRRGSCDGFGDPRRRSRSVGSSASAPGSVARSSADVLTAPATRSGCPCMVDMVRGSFRLCSAGGWLHVFQIVTARNGKVTLVFEAFRLADFWKQAIRTRLDRFLREKNALMFWKIDRFLILSKCSQQFHVRAHTKSHWQKM